MRQTHKGHRSVGWPGLRFHEDSLRLAPDCRTIGSDTAANHAFAVSVAVSGPTIVVGFSAHASATGRAYVFEG